MAGSKRGIVNIKLATSYLTTVCVYFSKRGSFRGLGDGRIICSEQSWNRIWKQSVSVVTCELR